MKSTYITNILKCVPPEDKPNSNELSNCSEFFNEEILNLKHLKVIVTLGKIAFDNCVKIYKKRFQSHNKYFFNHGQIQMLPDKTIIIPSYHPSPRNVNTGIITERMMVRLFMEAKKLAKL